MSFHDGAPLSVHGSLTTLTPAQQAATAKLLQPTEGSGSRPIVVLDASLAGDESGEFAEAQALAQLLPR